MGNLARVFPASQVSLASSVEELLPVDYDTPRSIDIERARAWRQYLRRYNKTAGGNRAPRLSDAACVLSMARSNCRL